MKFRWTAIEVTSMEESLNFYENIIGLKVSGRYKTGPDGEIAFLGNGDGENKLELIYNKGAKNLSFGDNVSIGFSVCNLDESIEFLNKNNIKFESEIISPAPNIRFIFVKDPDGFKIQLVEQK